VTELRVYINQVGAGMPGEQGVFYSRRADGPYYRWHYEDEAGHWLASRVRLSNLTLRALDLSNWQTVPPALQAMLLKHYLD
jgi:hypothetical protein